MENIERALLSQEAQAFQYTLTFDGVELHWEARVVPTGEDEVLVIVRDVTQRRRAELERDEHHAQRLEAERRLSQQQAQLAHVTRLTSLGEMVAVMAHEMTQPLAAISNYAAAATTQLSSLPETHRDVAAWIGKVSQQAARAGKIIQRLRGFVRRGERTLEPVSLDETIADAIALVDAHLRRLNVTTNFAAHGKPFDVIADRVQIQQVIVNLISNASEAMAAAADSSRVVEIRLTYDAAEAIMTVSDDGPGIAPQHAQRVFEPFYTTKPDGIGIGLSICRGIVESHGGQIWLTAGPTSFHVQLPRNPPPAN
jgi:C4-dicarboxylate-specific signal transduction histidine kinase